MMPGVRMAWRRLSRRAGRWIVPAALLAAIAGVPAQAVAQCRVRVNASVAFGTYNVFKDTGTDSDGQIAWRCNSGLHRTVMITLSRGNNFDGTWRRLESGADFLRYNLYRDSSRLSVWGDGTFGSSYIGTYPGSGWLTLRVYGRIPSAQDVGAGSYSDNTVVVINF